ILGERWQRVAEALVADIRATAGGDAIGISGWRGLDIGRRHDFTDGMRAGADTADREVAAGIGRGRAGLVEVDGYSRQARLAGVLHMIVVLIVEDGAADCDQGKVADIQAALIEAARGRDLRAGGQDGTARGNIIEREAAGA